MARWLFVDEGSRLGYRVFGSPLRSVAGLSATVYSDAAGTVVADIREYDGTIVPGPVIVGGVVAVDQYSRLPLFWGPEPEVTDLWVVIAGGPVVPVFARFQPQIDALSTGVGAALLKAQNLADLANVVTARSNLGLGTAAVENVGAFDPAGAAASAQAASAPRGVYTKSDLLPGTLDWINDSPTGYLLHLRTGPLSAGYGVIGIGTDQGAGNGLFIAHKNPTGRGVSVNNNPGSGIGVYITARSTSHPLYVESNPGSGAVRLQAGSAAGFSDGNTTIGSNVFTSATAAFTPADVGQAIVQVTSRGLPTDPDGSIPAGTTIASYVSPTQITMSANAAYTGSTILFAVAGRTKSSTESMLSVYNETSGLLHTLSKAGLALIAGNAAEEAFKVTGAVSQSADIAAVRVNGQATPVFAVASNGSTSASGSTVITNALALGGIPLTALTYSDGQPALALRRDPAKVGDLVQFRGGGSTALSRVNKDGYYITGKNAAPADADIATGEMALWFDSTNGAAKLMVKAKQADGTVKTAAVALA